METGRAHQHLGGMFTGVKWRDFRGALAHHDAALRALEERASLDPLNSVARRTFADQLVMLATAQNAARDGAGALAGTTRALAVLRELAAADPKNVEAQHDLAFVYEQMGIACTQLGRWDDAERAVREAIAIRERLVAADPGNREDSRGLVTLYGTLGNVFESRGDLAKRDLYHARAKEELAALSR
jgi:Flp pilus assembly protein TadD